MNERYIPVGVDKGFEIDVIGENIIFRYKILHEGKYIFGNSYKIPSIIIKKIIDQPFLIRGLLNDR